MSNANTKHDKDKHRSFFVVCSTLDDVYKAQQQYLQKKGLKLTLRQCVFQGNRTALKDEQ